jgi:DNA-binding NarL/FixJ family response regulator
MPARLLVVDRHSVCRSGIRMLMEREPDVEDTGDETAVLRMLQQQRADGLLLA